MTTIEIARRMAELGENSEAVRAYSLALDEDRAPAELLEAAAFILDNGGNYRLSFSTFVQLYNAGHFREDILPLMTRAFYEPNVRLIKNRYDRNCRLLEKYPYIFRKDFPSFADLPVSFFPYDDRGGYVPFDLRAGEFTGYVNVKETVVSRNFFRDLEKPVLAEDVYSQYELEYLTDNVRRSEDAGRENHLYLHYTSWEDFCAWLQVLNMKPLLEQKKPVFLIGEEIAQYPIDFKERFHIDYEKFEVKPVGIREVTRMIWHTQLSTHNGGDFFNEIFDAHPNLLAMPSIMFYNIEEQIAKIRTDLASAHSIEAARQVFQGKHRHIADELYLMRSPTDKDLLVAMYLLQEDWNRFVDPASRIVPAVFFQPHFHNIVYTLTGDASGNVVLDAENVRQIHNSAIFKGFKYIKTFTPMRRFTTSHGGTVRAMYRFATGEEKLNKRPEENKKSVTVVPDAVMQRVLNRSFMRDNEDRLYRDSVIVRFEDGKLNPKATFTALAAFLDLPYTESMTYCSEKGKHDPVTFAGQAIGFQTESVYKNYDEYANDSERQFIEYFLRDAYAFYGYDFHYYDGGPVDEARIKEWVGGFDTIDHYIRETWKVYFATLPLSRSDGKEVTPEQDARVREQMMKEKLEGFKLNRLRCAKLMMKGLRFVNKRLQPLEMTPLLQLDPALLENPIYH